MKLEPRTRKPYVDYLVQNCASLELGKHYLGWKAKKAGSARKKRAVMKPTVTPVRAPRAKPAASASKQVAPRTKATKHTKKTAVSTAKRAAVVTAVSKGRKPSAPAPPRAAARRARKPAKAAAKSPTPVAMLGPTIRGGKTGVVNLFERARNVAHVTPTFRFLNGERIQSSVPLSATVGELRKRLREHMLGLLAKEGHQVSAESVWLLLIIQGADLRPDDLAIRDTPLTDASVVHCLITPYTQGEAL